MPMDGCFVHYLVDELSNEVIGSKINKITQPNTYDILFSIYGKSKNQKLLVSSKLDAPRIYLTKEKYQNPEIPNNFCMVLRKYLERGIITNLTQHNNDRIIILSITSYNELDDEASYYLIIELMGRNSNIILTDSEYTIIDAIRKLPPSESSSRTILPHAKYAFPESNKKVNPFNLTDGEVILSELEGVSKSLLSSLEEKSMSEIIEFLSQKIKPCTYQLTKKIDFYAYPIDSNVDIISTYNSISDLLDSYYHTDNLNTNQNKIEIEKVIKKEIKKINQKLINLNLDLETANNNLSFIDLGVLLQANLYLIKKGDSKVEVQNFLNNNELITIELDPLLDPAGNLKQVFQKGKKAKSALIQVQNQIEIAEKELDYLNTIMFQLSISNNQEIEEIKDELIEYGYLQNKKKFKKKNDKPNITQYIVDGLTILVGKNNKQNDYLTHKVAFANDYWFHVKDIPGSHVIVRIPENQANFTMSEIVIRTAANIAAVYSQAEKSSSVPVDYTKVRNLKKIPGQKGSKVILTNQKTIYIDPDRELINRYLKS